MITKLPDKPNMIPKLRTYVKANPVKIPEEFAGE